MDRNEEIDQIRRELQILRDRYALYARWGRILKVFFMVWAPLFVISIAALALKLSAFDPVYAGFFFGVMAVAGAIIFWLYRTKAQSDWPRLPWTDIASPPPRFSAPYTDIRSYLFRDKPSDAQLIEEQIAERERRLAELGAMS